MEDKKYYPIFKAGFRPSVDKWDCCNSTQILHHATDSLKHQITMVHFDFHKFFDYAEYVPEPLFVLERNKYAKLFKLHKQTENEVTALRRELDILQGKM